MNSAPDDLDRIIERPLPLPRLEPGVPLPDELDVVGDWGYTMEAHCILLDPVFVKDPNDPAYGKAVACEYAFMPERIERELQRMPMREQFEDVRMEVVRQELRFDKDKRRFDRLLVSVSALKTEDAAKLRETFPEQDWEDEDYMAAREKVAYEAISEFWFDLEFNPWCGNAVSTGGEGQN